VTAAEGDSGAGVGPLVVRIVLGARLRELREAKGISREDAGWHIRGSDSKISRMELGRVGLKARDVKDLLIFYGVGEPEFSALMQQAQRANSPAWWRFYHDVTPSWFHSYLGLEAEAALIRTYEVQFVPGLLQTPDYARAIVRLGHAEAPDDEIDRRVELRIQRQDVLCRERPPQLWAILDEAVLRRPIGGPRVMAAQVRALAEICKQPSVTLQILPFSSGGHAAMGGAFSILRFPDQELPDVVYLERMDGATYLDRRSDVDLYTEAMDTLLLEAERPDRTPAILDRIARKLA
jgi:transcriptional regulator with XRE-family HTH domain